MTLIKKHLPSTFIEAFTMKEMQLITKQLLSKGWNLYWGIYYQRDETYQSIYYQKNETYQSIYYQLG